MKRHTGTLAKRLTIAREMRGLSLNGLAKKAGLGTGMVPRFESGEREPNVTTAQRLAAALDVRFAWLTIGEGPMTSDEETREEEIAERAARRIEAKLLPRSSVSLDSLSLAAMCVQAEFDASAISEFIVAHKHESSTRSPREWILEIDQRLTPKKGTRRSGAREISRPDEQIGRRGTVS